MPAKASIPTAVLGSGTMGSQIALALALGGNTVRLWGRRESAFEDAKQRLDAAFDFLVDQGLVDASLKGPTLDAIEFESNLAHAVAGAEFIIEAVVEELDTKRAVLEEAEKSASDTAILSSTTSALSSTQIAQGLQRPQLFCIAHYAQPAHLVKLVEVVPAENTSDDTLKFVMGLLTRTDKTPVLCPDIPGFLWARIQHAVLREFASLVGQGLVTPEACDTILKQGYASRLPAMGAFEHADLAGLDLLNGAAAKAVWKDLSNVDDPSLTPVGTLFKQGHTGMKSGQGFYDWRVRDADAFKKNRDSEIVRRIKIQAGGEVVLSE